MLPEKMSYNKLLQNDLSRILTLLRNNAEKFPSYPIRALALVREMGPHNLSYYGIHLRCKGRTFKHVKTIHCFLFSAKSIGKIIRTGLKIQTKRPLQKNNTHNDDLSHGITTNIALVKKIYVRKQYCN